MLGWARFTHLWFSSARLWLTFANMPENRDRVRELKKAGENFSTSLMAPQQAGQCRRHVMGGETPLSFQQASDGLRAETAHAEDLLCIGIEGKREGGCPLASAARAEDVCASSCGDRQGRGVRGSPLSSLAQLPRASGCPGLWLGALPCSASHQERGGRVNIWAKLELERLSKDFG